jgi:hypothetical protein
MGWVGMLAQRGHSEGWPQSAARERNPPAASGSLCFAFCWGEHLGNSILDPFCGHRNGGTKVDTGPAESHPVYDGNIAENPLIASAVGGTLTNQPVVDRSCSRGKISAGSVAQIPNPGSVPRREERKMLELFLHPSMNYSTRGSKD